MNNPSVKKTMSTRAQMLLAGGMTIVVGFAATIGLLSWQSSKAQKSLAADYLQQIAASHAGQIQQELTHALDAAQNLGQSLAALPAAGVTDRNVAHKLMEYALQKNPDFVSMTVVFEPNAFDGRDSAFAGQQGMPPEGRYAWYIDRDKDGHFKMNPALDFLQPGAGNYYLLPKETLKDTLIEPYSFAYDGAKPEWLTSVATPVMVNDKLKLVVSSDILLSSIQKKINQIKPWQGTGYALLISNSGNVISSPDTSEAGKKWPGNVNSTSTNVTEQYDPVLKEQAMYTWYPVRVGKSDKPWYVGIVAPVSQVMAAADRQLYWAIGLMIISILSVGAVLGLLFSRKVMRPLGGEPAEAARIALAVAEGRLNNSIGVAPDDSRSLFYALSTMQSQLRTMVGQIKDASLSVQQGAGEIASANLNLSSRTEEQAAALEETAASMEQISAAIRMNADNAQQATGLTENATRIANRGETLVDQVVTTMAKIDESSQKIGDITTLINSIAFQTNILALNAAVEAARAGEQGRGFAVVASEVRNLAQRTTSAVKDIAALIEESALRVENGVVLVNDAGKTMHEMTNAVSSVQRIIGEIVAASDEQARGIAQVTIAVNEMDGTTQQNAALVQQMSAASSSLEDQARQLAQTVAQFH
ncbi:MULTISPECIES: methyl-accepting chemotaxis protein [Pantoea]|uniref:Chemotaxis protein n=1 Tax=Pantoea stewartii TaxID=66269 RepID=A0AB34VD56_9GAMM|nr:MULTISPECIES: methyl-accepting chemotaxis protein [Pantoea]KTS71143.1 chemotaxis protein [Pantoea stewartii]KTS95807.1 chemotaxis protein [Pantoea stewartii]KTT06115.1 chemotaxis protein [Pantoea stewartii]MDF7786305.1 methyl-accepting chemotaxis protein [Pantoea stewartii]PXV74664.1 methyl-accepting chemotaxis protein [Pantoea sp. PNA 03-3]